MDEDQVYKRFQRAMEERQAERASAFIDRLRQGTTWETHSVESSLDRGKSVEAGTLSGPPSTDIVFVIFGLFSMYTVSKTV